MRCCTLIRTFEFGVFFSFLNALARHLRFASIVTSIASMESECIMCVFRRVSFVSASLLSLSLFYSVLALPCIYRGDFDKWVIMHNLSDNYGE